MNIDHVHFYVESAAQWRDWFVQKFGFQVLANQVNHHSHQVLVGCPTIRFWLSSSRSLEGPVAEYLRQHPAGIADLAFQVRNLEVILQQAAQMGVPILQPIQSIWSPEGWRRSAQIQGWGDLRHTLIEQEPSEPDGLPNIQNLDLISLSELEWGGIDHAVLNVKQGDLEAALRWYESLFGLQRRQNFVIHTKYSALCSQVLTHPSGSVQLPINQPASADSQIQEFLDWNRGSGIQHLALRTRNIVPRITQLRQQGIAFLSVPCTYYEQLRQRTGFSLETAEYQTIAQQQVLVDWQPDQPEAILLQAFTQPIFDQPTFFFELIERRTYEIEQRIRTATGFGERNFQALFEAIEREQMKRGSLKARKLEDKRV